MRLKILGVQGSTSIKTITAVIKNMKLEEAAAVLTTTGLTEAEAANLLVKKGLCSSTEEASKALTAQSAGNVAAAGSTDLLTAAWLKLKAAGKGVITTIQAHPILATLAATAAAIGIVIAAYKKANPSTETLAKNLDESKQKIQESTQKITEMESELGKVQSRIDELQSMGSLTIVEQKELSNLKESNALLTRNLELEKQKKRLENKQVNEDFIKWFDSAMGHKSGLEQSAAIATSVPQPTGDPIANGLGNAVNYLLNKNKDEIYEDNATIGNQFKRIDELLEERKTATGERIEEIENSLKEAFDYLNNIDTELNNEMKDLDLEYTPDAKKGSQEYEINQRIVEAEEFKNKLLLKTADYQGGIPEAYEAVLNNTLDSSRFAEAAKEIEKLKTAEDGTVRKSKDFEKALYEAITKAPDGSNIKELANYLEELGMIKVNPEIGVDGITDFSNAIVESIDETDKATQSNLLFADSFSKITSARKAFEEGLSSVETGTEDFESYADSYEKAMELLNKGYDLDNGVLMAHVERLISDKQLKKLGYDADKVKAFLQEHLKGVFGDKDTDAPGNGLIDKIEKNADEDGKIYAKDKNGNIDKTRELASYKDGNWHISDDTKDIEALGKEFGMTTDQILSCIKAMKTFSDVDLNDTETIIKQLKEENKVFSVTDKTETTNKDGKKTTKKSKKSAVNISQVESDMKASGQYSSKDISDTIEQLKNDDNVITVEIDTKTKSPKVAEELEKLGIFSGTKTYGKGKSKWTSTTTTDIDKATEALKTFGLTGQEAYEKLKGLDIYETQKDGTQKFLADVEKIESVIKTFNSDLDLNAYKSINLKGDIPEGGKRTEVVNVVPLKEELEKKGYSSQFIDEYIKSLEQQKHIVTIDTSIEFTQKGDVTTVEDQLVAAGVATKGEDGKYTIDVKETVTLLKNTGADSDDIITFLNNLKSAAEQDGSLTLTFSSNVSSIEGEVNNVYQAFDDTKNKANEAKSATEEAKASAESYNNTSLENIESSWSRTAEQIERNGTAIATAKEMLDAINGSTYTYNVKPVETRPTNVPSDFVGPVLPSKFGVANGTANISGTALAGGNWGTAPGGKTLTGELG